MPLGNEPAKILQQKMHYQGRKFSFNVDRIELPNGVIGEWESIRHPGGALAVPITPDGKLVLVKQYRFPTQGRILEFPAYRAGKWLNLGEFFLAPGYCDEIIYAFLAMDLEKLEIQPPGDDDEDISVVLMNQTEFETAIHSGEPIDAKSIAAYFLARKFLFHQDVIFNQSTYRENR